MSRGGGSLWVDGRAPAHPGLAGDATTDVLVVGAGITGLTAADELARTGHDVRVIESRLLGSGATGFTTAKISTLHGAVYHRLEQRRGPEVAARYAEADRAGFDRLLARIDELGIGADCDLERRDALTYVTDPERVGEMEAEAAAARRAGLAAELVHDTDLPFPVGAAVCLADQAQFDPLPYLRALAGQVVAAGGHVHEGTRALGLQAGSRRRHRVVTDQGAVDADHVLVCTGTPFLDRSLAFARLEPLRSYCVAGRVAGDLPRSMSISADGPTRSLRTAKAPDGSELLLVGGAGHEVGRDGDTRDRYDELEAWAAEHFAVEDVGWRWSTQDYRPLDDVPYVGRSWGLPDGVLLASGYAKWGMTKGTTAGLTLAALVEGRALPWLGLVDPRRLDVIRSGRRFASVNGKVGWHLVADRVRTSGTSVPPLAEGEGRVVRSGLIGRTAVTRVDGALCAVSGVCPHLGGALAWNAAERSWDCPLHGSRFAPTGELLQGPAVEDLEARTPPT